MLQENLLYFEEENVSIADFFLIILFIWDVSNIIYFKGYIPIADLKSFKNKFNRGNQSVDNPWELFFYQPYNYTYREVKKYSKNYSYVPCTQTFSRPHDLTIYYHNSSLHYWHDFAK